MDMFKLDGKVALVTGATGGLGQAMAIALAQAGCDVAGSGSSGQFDDTRAGVEGTGRLFHGIQGDLSQMDDVRELIPATVEHFGHIDILVNNAGIIRRSPCVDFSEEDWDAVMNVNLKAAFFLAQAAAREFDNQKSGGKIINIASLLSFQGGILVPSYAASKSGLAGITRTMANEWASRGINVNAIAPGYIATANTKALREDAIRSKSILDRIPAGRWGEPTDLAGMVIFLASRASDYCHGGVYPVDGGWLSR